MPYEKMKGTLRALVLSLSCQTLIQVMGFVLQYSFIQQIIYWEPSAPLSHGDTVANMTGNVCALLEHVFQSVSSAFPRVFLFSGSPCLNRLKCLILEKFKYTKAERNIFPIQFNNHQLVVSFIPLIVHPLLLPYIKLFWQHWHHIISLIDDLNIFSSLDTEI